jgi:hypothetical protein
MLYVDTRLFTARVGRQSVLWMLARGAYSYYCALRGPPEFACSSWTTTAGQWAYVDIFCFTSCQYSHTERNEGIFTRDSERRPGGGGGGADQETEKI